jgi:hypothetical protein
MPGLNLPGGALTLGRFTPAEYAKTRVVVALFYGQTEAAAQQQAIFPAAARRWQPNAISCRKAAACQFRSTPAALSASRVAKKCPTACAIDSAARCRHDVEVISLRSCGLVM